jgi:hypothetical protein
MVEAARALPERLQFVGGHPLAGAARGGIEASRPDLFERRPWVLTPDLSTPRATVDRLAAFVRALGGSPFELDPETHDHVLAYTSHLPQLTASALMHVVGEAVGESGPAAVGRRPRRHDARRGQPRPHLERHLRDQRGPDPARTRPADCDAAGDAHAPDRRLRRSAVRVGTSLARADQELRGRRRDLDP